MKQLAQIPIFQGVSGDELEQLGSIARKHAFKAGNVVFFEGDRADSLYVILSGSAKVYQTTSDGQVKSTTITSPGFASPSRLCRIPGRFSIV